MCQGLFCIDFTSSYGFSWMRFKKTELQTSELRFQIFEILNPTLRYKLFEWTTLSIHPFYIPFNVSYLLVCSVQLGNGFYSGIFKKVREFEILLPAGSSIFLIFRFWTSISFDFLFTTRTRESDRMLYWVCFRSIVKGFKSRCLGFHVISLVLISYRSPDFFKYCSQQDHRFS